jgi:hypothetical protein
VSHTETKAERNKKGKNTWKNESKEKKERTNEMKEERWKG